jgi:Protein of unknown function (DUF2852)
LYPVIVIVETVDLVEKLQKVAAFIPRRASLAAQRAIPVPGDKPAVDYAVEGGGTRRLEPRGERVELYPTDQMRPAGTWWQPPPRPSGNRAFDQYRHETWLEEEQREFQEFLARLRMAKDKAEFDQFMAERRTRSGHSTADNSDPSSSSQD